jgi:hypothetical protein
MDKDDSRYEKPDLRLVQVRIEKSERDEAMDQDMGELPQETPDFELVQLFELEDEVRDEMRQDKF